MACLPLPSPPPLPALPPGISLDPALPAPNLAAELCCKIVALPPIPPLPPLGIGIFNPAVAAAIDALLDQILAYVQARPLSCPKE